jgi:hypothetical protein
MLSLKISEKKTRRDACELSDNKLATRPASAGTISASRIKELLSALRKATRINSLLATRMFRRFRFTNAYAREITISTIPRRRVFSRDEF